jgi:hypothetical protein
MGKSKRRRNALGPVSGAPASWAWHYTLGRKIPLILRDGALRDAWLQDHPEDFTGPIPSSIWFTAAETVDPTSIPALILANTYHFDREAFKRIAGGAWRIGYPLPHPSLSTYEEALAIHPPGSAFGGWLHGLTSYGCNKKDWRISWELMMPLTGCRIEEEQGGLWVPRAIDKLSLDEGGPGYGCPGVAVEVTSADFVDGEWFHFSRMVAC